MAGLIPQTFIDDLLARADIVDVVESRVKLRKTGKNYSGLCPFHNEKTPSFTVEPDKQFYYCFGCGAGGNAIGFVMNYENLDFPEAIENIAHGMGLEVPREQTSSGQGRQRKEAQEGLYDILKRAATWYQGQLRSHAERQRAIDYLKGRQLSGEIARDFGLGFAPPGWDNLLQALGDTEARRKLLVDAGLLIEAADNPRRPLYDRFRDRIIYPIRDRRGRVIAFGGRVLGDDKPKYLNSPETEVFHKGRELYGLYEARRKLRTFERVLMVEGYMDVIALAQHGIYNAAATLGTATSASHLQTLFKLTPEVVFCFDGDQAGRTAAWRALEQVMPLMEDGRQARFLFLPEGEDPDTQVRKSGASGFNERVRQATSLAEFFFESLGTQVDMNTLEGRARLGSLAMPLVKQLPKGIFRQLILDQLSRITGTDIRSLFEADPSAPGPAPSMISTPSGNTPQMPRPGQARMMVTTRPQPASACMKAINLVLLDPAIATVDMDPELEEVDSPDMALLLQVIALAKRHPGSSTYQLLGRVYGTPLGAQLTQLLNREHITPPEGIAREFNDILAHLLSTHRRRKRHTQMLEEARHKLLRRRQGQDQPPPGGQAGGASQ